MHFAVWNTNRAGMEKTRRENIDALVAYFRDHIDHPDVTVHHAGPTHADDGETVIGSLLVIEAPSLDAVRAFVADSPFGKAGLFAASHAHPWTWATGRPD